MPDTDTATALDRARDHAAKCWRLFTDNRNMRSPLGRWETSSTPDGSVLVSAEVTGSGAAYALARFAADYHITLPNPGDVRPQFDINAVGRTVLVWRCLGVWVELWHPDSTSQPAAVPEPVLSAPAPSQDASTAGVAVAPPVRRSLLRPSGRLPFTRKRSDKETATS